MDATAYIREYYDALRAGDPLAPFFAGSGGEQHRENNDERGARVVKFGISERLVGPDAIREGLKSQTETTTDWTVESRALRVTDRGCHAWFSDDVYMAWTDTERTVDYEFDTRWSGTLESRADGTVSEDGEWQFVGMHVSTAGTL